jgi:Thymidylate kinase
MTFSVSISGIDWCWKTSTIAGVSEELWAHYLTAKIGRPSYIIWPWVIKTELTNLISSKIEDYRPLVNKRWIKPIIAWLNAAYAINQWNITKTALEQFDLQVMINSRDIVVDSIIYSTFYIPPSRYIGTRTKSKALQYITWSSLPDMFVYMDIEPEVSIERIIQSWRPLDKHENIKDLSRLRDNYEEAMGYLYGHTDTKVFPIDVNELTLEQVIRLMTNSIKEQISITI